MKIILLTTLPNRVASALECLLKENLYIFDITKVKDKKNVILKSIYNNSPDILITYRCPYILPDEIITALPFGAYNIHPSLLPKYKGCNPWTEIFNNHESTSGVTLHRITKKIDCGMIVFQESFNINADDNVKSARDKADKIAEKIAINFVKNLNYLYL